MHCVGRCILCWCVCGSLGQLGSLTRAGCVVSFSHVISRTWTIIPTFTTIVVEGCLAVCVTTLREILRPAYCPVHVSGLQWPQHVVVLSFVSNAEVNNTGIVASTPPCFFMSQWEGSGKNVLIFIFLPPLLEEVICIRLGIVLLLIYGARWNHEELFSLQVKNGFPGLSNESQRW
jgi:hypothetical protein